VAGGGPAAHLSRSRHGTTIADAPAAVAALLHGLSVNHSHVVVMYDIINALAAEEGDVVAAESKEIDGVTEKPQEKPARRRTWPPPTTVFVSFLICMCRSGYSISRTGSIWHRVADGAHCRRLLPAAQLERLLPVPEHGRDPHVHVRHTSVAVSTMSELFGTKNFDVLLPTASMPATNSAFKIDGAPLPLLFLLLLCAASLRCSPAFGCALSARTLWAGGVSVAAEADVVASVGKNDNNDDLLNGEWTWADGVGGGYSLYSSAMIWHRGRRRALRS